MPRAHCVRAAYPAGRQSPTTGERRAWSVAGWLRRPAQLQHQASAGRRGLDEAQLSQRRVLVEQPGPVGQRPQGRGLGAGRLKRGCAPQTGRDHLGGRDPQVVRQDDVAHRHAERRDADGKAVGGACRHAGRALEDCYALNRKADKAAVFAGWREMNDYMRENKIEVVSPQLGQPTETAGKAPRADSVDSSAEPAPKSATHGS